jgi:hypothetical protein
VDTYRDTIPALYAQSGIWYEDNAATLQAGDRDRRTLPVSAQAWAIELCLMEFTKQQAICRKVRNLVHARGPRQYLSLRPCHRPDPGRVITGGDGNTTARMVAIRNGDAINTRALTQYPVTVVPVPGGVAVMFVRRNP